jgi:hypothetical protein
MNPLLLALPFLTLAAEPPAPDTLPVKAVTLFSSGVSYTLREGEVTGDATVPLRFRTAQINDILKSLVLLDERGTVQPALYGARDPIGRTLQGFAVDLTRPTSRAELLNQLRGQKVTVEAGGNPVPGSNPPATTPRRTMIGQLVGIDGAPTPGGGAPTGFVLLLLSDAGLESVRLDDVTSVRIADARLNREFSEALTLLASGADDSRRSVTLNFSGTGKRTVRVGYLAEAPLWKISYRLVLDAARKPYLQGWALVENTTDEDWLNVRLALVSGRPISFIQDLYQPLYLPRPVVGPDIIASPRPQTAEGALEDKKDMDLPKALLGRNRGALSGGGPGGFGGGSAMDVTNEAIASAPALGTAMEFSTTAQAAGQRSGELFSYAVKTPVTLPRQQAAMIPVIAQAVDGDKVSLYNADIDPRFPRNAVRLKNTTGLHLKGGPVTLFDADTYAGDATMEDVPPGDSRLLPYAVDLAVAGERRNGDATRIETGVSIRRGVLTLTRRQTQETLYTLRSKADTARTVLIEHPFRPELTLVAPKAFEERTASFYRFAVTVPAGKTTTLAVRSEQPISETVGLLDMDLNLLEVTTTRKTGVAESVKAALREVLARRRRVQELSTQAETREAQIKAIADDQNRIRQNMSALDRNNPLYKRYVTQLDEQETRIQTLREAQNTLRKQAADADTALRAFVDTLDLPGER